MPSSVLPSAKHCSTAQRRPLSQTKVLNGVLAGALLMAKASDGSAPNVRLITSQTVRSGRPSLHRVTRCRANAYAIGPLVPSDTFRRYQREAGRLAATAATVLGGLAGTTTTRVARASPLYV